MSIDSAAMVKPKAKVTKKVALPLNSREAEELTRMYVGYLSLLVAKDSAVPMTRKNVREVLVRLDEVAASLDNKPPRAVV